MPVHHATVPLEGHGATECACRVFLRTRHGSAPRCPVHASAMQALSPRRGPRAAGRVPAARVPSLSVCTSGCRPLRLMCRPGDQPVSPRAEVTRYCVVPCHSTGIEAGRGPPDSDGNRGRGSVPVPAFRLEIGDGDGGESPIPDKSGTGTGERPRSRPNRGPSPGRSPIVGVCRAAAL